MSFSGFCDVCDFFFELPHGNIGNGVSDSLGLYPSTPIY